jgi:hypothetical protein
MHTQWNQYKRFKGMDVFCSPPEWNSVTTDGSQATLLELVPYSYAASNIKRSAFEHVYAMYFSKLCLVLKSPFDTFWQVLESGLNLHMLQFGMQNGEAVWDMGESVCACAMFVLAPDNFVCMVLFSISGLYSVRGVGNSDKMPREKKAEEDCCSNYLNLNVSVHNFWSQILRL